MTSYGYGFCPQSPSYTAMKYLREYIPHRAMLPGERYRLHLDMEAKVTTKYSFLSLKLSFFLYVKCPPKSIFMIKLCYYRYEGTEKSIVICEIFQLKSIEDVALWHRQIESLLLLAHLSRYHIMVRPKILWTNHYSNF